jgi:hypothetical protein
VSQFSDVAQLLNLARSTPKLSLQPAGGFCKSSLS